jgi:hypothetical protein
MELISLKRKKQMELIKRKIRHLDLVLVKSCTAMTWKWGKRREEQIVKELID